MSTFDPDGAHPDSMVCACGHTAYWHGGTQSQGACERHPLDGTCPCKRFKLARVDTIESLRAEIARLLKPPEDGPRRYVVMVCDGCEDCEPTDGSPPSRYPCRNSVSATGREMVLAEDYDTMARINAERERELRRVHNDSGRLRATP